MIDMVGCLAADPLSELTTSEAWSLNLGTRRDVQSEVFDSRCSTAPTYVFRSSRYDGYCNLNARVLSGLLQRRLDCALAILAFNIDP